MKIEITLTDLLIERLRLGVRTLQRDETNNVAARDWAAISLILDRAATAIPPPVQAFWTPDQ